MSASCLLPVVLITLQVRICGIILGHDFVNETGALIGIVFIQGEESFKPVVDFPPN
jgi:hypothetical protein